MPLNKDIKKVLVIGSGPIVIGQAAEFDYAGTQACRALKEEGLEVVLVNSNPATIMTDNAMADEIYIEPLTIETIKRIIIKERPDSILSTLGGQTGLTLSMQLAKEGFLQEHNVKLLGANLETIDKAEDRQIFKDTMCEIGQPCIPSKVVEDLDDALNFAKEIGYPVIVRPAFTLGGTGGGIANNVDELKDIGSNGLRVSPIHQVLIEKCISGWKEIEFECIRDAKGNKITVCSMENIDPVGVHTGDSIVIAPAVTLTDKEYQMLRKASLDIVESLGIEGGCNCQFALHPESFEYAVIEVNPRVSRSSALASKATGYPIAKVATKIAIGYNLDEIRNAVTKETYACFEPAIDYVVVKLPKWPFDKFVYAKRALGTQMKATGEVMSIGTNFETALMKAVRGAEISLEGMSMPKLEKLSDKEIDDKLHLCEDERIFVVYEALKRGVSVEKIHELTMIDEWFLYKLINLLNIENELKKGLNDELYIKAKKFGFPDSLIKKLANVSEIKKPLHASYKMVDTCAGEFKAHTPYFYSTYDEASDVDEFINKSKDSKKETVIVFGSGPIRIGQGIEFDYASVHSVWALKEKGYDVVIMNNNPETVSTDFDTADRLYFEPLTKEDVLNVIRVEKPIGVVVAFGGQTAIKLTKFLEKEGVKIIGTSTDSIDRAEDRERFDELLEQLKIKRPAGNTVFNLEQALKSANELGYPVLIRPSYVLGGQNMIIAFSDDDVREYMDIILKQNIENPVLIDKYLMGTEIEVDAICDGEEILIPGIMEHIERAGIHSGDSIAVYPAWNINGEQTEKLIDYTKKLAVALETKGLVNIQYVLHAGEIYVIEVNPRASRTVPYISKVTGVPMVDLATSAMLGKKIKDMGYGTGLYKKPPYVAVKVPVFSFEKLSDVDILMGPEMKSTGEVLGIGKNLDEALFKGLTAAGYKMRKSGSVFITVRNIDKAEACDIAKEFYEMGFELYATKGTAEFLKKAGLKAKIVDRIHESDNNALTLIEAGKIDYIVSTSSKGRIPSRESVKIRRKAIERAIPCFTSIDTANALLRCLRGRYNEKNTELVDINHMRATKSKKKFIKMQACGNDYIYFNCFDQKIISPESLSVSLSNRHFGIGGDGIVLIESSDVADAKMRMFNLDGSEGKMCGNAIRCVGKFLYENGIVRKDIVTIETLSGIKTLRLYFSDGNVDFVKVDMGKYDLSPKSIGIKSDKDIIVNEKVKIAGKEYNITCVSMGNPHCVIFTDSLNSIDIEKIGSEIENAPMFQDKTNVEFVTVISRDSIKLRVWERGSGETMACGTGACASVVAAILNGFVKENEEITVKLKGGDLAVTVVDGTVYMTGNAVNVFEGEILI